MYYLLHILSASQRKNPRRLISLHGSQLEMTANADKSAPKGQSGKTERVSYNTREAIMECAQKSEGWAEAVAFVAKFARKFHRQFGREGMEGYLNGSLRYVPKELRLGRTRYVIPEPAASGAGATPKTSRPPRLKPAPGNAS